MVTDTGDASIVPIYTIEYDVKMLLSSKIREDKGVQYRIFGRLFNLKLLSDGAISIL